VTADQLARVAITETPRLTQLSLRLDPAGPSSAPVAAVLGARLPTAPCTWAAAPEADLLWLGPDEWLLLAPPDTADLAPSLRHAIAPHFGTVTDVSSQRTAFDLTGPGAPDLLAHGCAIDLHPRSSPTGTCVQTLLAQTGVTLLVLDDAPQAPTLRLLVRTSFAPYLRSWLGDVASGT
jgi:sarcosine oxidase, subunit gamma